MGTYHTIKQGDHLVKLAKQHGFLNYNTVWMAGENAELRAKRPDPNVLYPGDVVFIPDKVERFERRPTGQTHVFQLDLPKLKLRIKIRDFDNLPMAGLDCVLTVEGREYKLTTNGDGQIEQDIPHHAESGTLAIPALDIEYAVHLGHIDPVEQESGWKARLVNLGYYFGDIKDPEEDQRISWSLEEFQCDYGLTVTGKPDAATKAKLKEVYGS